MLLDKELKAFFNKDKTPNWKKYYSYSDFSIFPEFTDDNDEKRAMMRRCLKFINYEYAKKGFLIRKGGYKIVDFYDEKIISFGRMFGGELNLSSKNEAGKLREVIKKFKNNSGKLYETPFVRKIKQK